MPVDVDEGFLCSPMTAFDDPEGDRVPGEIPPVIDAHVHVFPDAMWKSLWRWFDQNAWPVRYRFTSEEVLRFLLDRGVQHIVALQYAHRPGMARSQNAFMADLCRRVPHVTGLATVFPGEPDAASILAEGFAMGLAGVKLHLHVQGLAANSEGLAGVYESCATHDKPLVMHAGREPKSPAYPVDPHDTCSAARVERVLRDHPRLRLCIPHFGADEFEGFGALLERYDNLWLDTTMMLGGFFPLETPWWLVEERPDRIMYGTDFPNIPFAWDRELKVLVERGLPTNSLTQILSNTARAFFQVHSG